MNKTKLIFLLFFTSTIYAINLCTPNGKSFSTFDAGRPSYDEDWYAYYSEYEVGPSTLYPNSEVVGEWEDGLWEYNCHVFAWNNWQGADRWSSESDMWTLGKPSPYNLLWRNYPDVWYTDSDNPIGIVSYIETSTQSEASVLTYISGSTKHSGINIYNNIEYVT